MLGIFTGWQSGVCCVSHQSSSFLPEQSERGEAASLASAVITVTSRRSEASPTVRPRPTSLQSWLGLTNHEAGSGEQSTNTGRDLYYLGQTRWEVVHCAVLGPGLQTRGLLCTPTLSVLSNLDLEWKFQNNSFILLHKLVSSTRGLHLQGRNN